MGARAERGRRIIALAISSCIYAALLSAPAHAQPASGWMEEAVAVPIKDSDLIMMEFQFAIEAVPGDPAAAFVPPALWALSREHRFERLEVTLGRGQHAYGSAPPPQWAQVPPPGLELRVAWPSRATPADIGTALQGLAASLAPLVGASVPTLATHGVVSGPAVVWIGREAAALRPTAAAALPQEGPCLDSVTAFLKMLPCRGGAGLAGLISPERFVAAKQHSLRLILAAPTGPTGAQRLTLNFMMAAEPADVEWRNATGEPVAALRMALGVKPPVEGAALNAWEACPAAERTLVAMPPPEVNGTMIGLRADCALAPHRGTPPAAGAWAWDPPLRLQVCTLPAGRPDAEKEKEQEKERKKTGVGLYPGTKALRRVCPPPKVTPNGIVVREEWRMGVASASSTASPSRARLSLLAVIIPPSPVKFPSLYAAFAAADAAGDKGTDALLHITLTIPWELRPRWHTLKLHVNNEPLAFDPVQAARDERENERVYGPRLGPAPTIAWRHFRRATPRRAAALVEVLLRLPAVLDDADELKYPETYAVSLAIEVDKQLIPVADLPPDASRGIDVPAPTLALVPPNPQGALPWGVTLDCQSLVAAAAGCAGDGPVLVSRGAPTLVTLPIPDASMPFNVVCFTSTAIAVAFGSALNAMLKAPGAAEGSGGAKAAIKARLLRLVLVAVVMGAVVVYVDKDAQRKVQKWLEGAGLLSGASGGGTPHAEL